MTPRTASRALTGATLALLLTAPSPEASLRGLGQAGTAPLDPVVDLVALAAWACAALAAGGGGADHARPPTRRPRSAGDRGVGPGGAARRTTGR